MKTFATVALSILISCHSFASFVGWISSEPQNWKFIQSVGGIDIDPVVQLEGKPVLPVTCDVSGLSYISCKPTAINSGIVLRKFELKHSDKTITIRVITSLPDGVRISKRSYIDLSKLKRGIYQVYYETTDDPEKRLGAVEIK